MRKLISLTVVTLIVLAATAWAAITLPVSQDWLMGRLAVAGMTSTPGSDVDGLRVVVCGSASPLGNDPARAQACIAVITPDHFFLFDVGAGSPVRMSQAGLPMNRLDAVFLTHFHSDHIAALGDVNLNSWVMGRSESLSVYGPGGVEKVVGGFNQAYELDRGYRVTHHGADLLPPAAGPMTPIEFEPGTVWQHGDTRVTAFAVNHSPISPAVGYRVDYKGRSVVISGDTVAVDSLFTAAKGADLLFHDALSRPLLDTLIASAGTAGRDRIARVMTDVIDYHADASKLESLSRTAGVRQLVMYHLVPVPANLLTERIFRRDLDQGTILARDLMVFDLPAGSSEIVVR